MSPQAYIVTPPYTGAPPPGLTKASDIAFWNAFIKLDNAITNPASADGFLFYSGDGGATHNLGCIRQYISEFYSRDVAAWPYVFDLKVVLSPDRKVPLTKMRELFESYLAEPVDESTTPNLHIKCLSWSIARRAAIHGGTVHLALWKGDPLLVKDSYWGEFEAGIITDPRSNVERIVRWDVEKLSDGSIAIDPGMVVWEREKHKPLGIPNAQQDWIVGPSGDYHKEDVVWHAEPLDRGKGPGQSLRGILKRFGSMGISKA